jgi:membrane-bound ClpP family serine protease
MTSTTARPLRRAALAIIVVGAVLLAAGFLLHNDLLGFFFMVCLVVGVVTLVADAMLRRWRPSSSVPDRK